MYSQIHVYNSCWWQLAACKDQRHRQSVCHGSLGKVGEIATVEIAREIFLTKTRNLAVINLFCISWNHWNQVRWKKKRKTFFLRVNQGNKVGLHKESVVLDSRGSEWFFEQVSQDHWNNAKKNQCTCIKTSVCYDSLGWSGETSTNGFPSDNAAFPFSLKTFVAGL